MTESFMPAGMPLPQPDPDSPDVGFWEACNHHELVVQRCSDCGVLRHTPELICHECYSFKYDWHKVSGKATVYSHMNVVHPVHPALRDRVPFNVVLVELSDAPGIRMIGNLVDCAYEDIHIGMPVEVVFEDHPNEGVTLPLWKRTDK